MISKTQRWCSLATTFSIALLAKPRFGAPTRRGKRGASTQNCWLISCEIDIWRISHTGILCGYMMTTSGSLKMLFQPFQCIIFCLTSPWWNLPPNPSSFHQALECLKAALFQCVRKELHAAQMDFQHIPTTPWKFNTHSPWKCTIPKRKVVFQLPTHFFFQGFCCEKTSGG